MSALVQNVYHTNIRLNLCTSVQSLDHIFTCYSATLCDIHNAISSLASFLVLTLLAHTMIVIYSVIWTQSHGPTKGHTIAENQNMKTLGFGFIHRLCRQIVMFYATRNYAMGVCVVLAALYTVCDTTVGRIFVCLGPLRTLTIEVITRYCHFKMRAWIEG